MNDLPTSLKWMVWGAIVLGLVGSITGLILGLDAYPPTAWFAVIEVGLPATIVGAFLGLAVGAALGGIGRLRPPHRP